MAICNLCEEQARKQRYTDPHKFLKPIGERRTISGVSTGGYKEQDYICTQCGAKFTYSNDKYDYGWILHGEKK